MRLNRLMRITSAALALTFPDAIAAERIKWKVVQGWIIYKDAEEQSCSAGSIFQGAGETILSVDYTPSTDTAELRIGNKGWLSLKNGDDPRVKVVLGSETYTDVETRSLVTSDYRWLLMNFHGLEFLRDFALAPSMQMYRGDVVVDKLNLTGTRAAVPDLITCANSINKGIARDPFVSSDGRRAGSGASRVSQTAAVRGSLGQFFGIDSYPPSALREGAQGRVVATLTVGTDGRVTDCSIATSSGNAALDEATCRISRQRVRFTPAKDESGSPIASTFILPVSWTLSDSEPAPIAPTT